MFGPSRAALRATPLREGGCSNGLEWFLIVQIIPRLAPGERAVPSFLRYRAVTFGSLPLVACVLTTHKNISPIGHDGDYGILDVNL